MSNNFLGIPKVDDYIDPPSVTWGEDDLKKYLDEHAYSDMLKVPEDEAVLYYDGVLIGSRGNIVAINGRPKSRKSVIASAIMSSCFCNEFLGFTTTFKKDPKVLSLDTEQGFGHWVENARRVLRDAGLVKKPEGFFSHHSRDAEPDFRLELVGYALKIYKPDVLLIDGITDLVYDLNDNKEATKTGSKLMKWSVEYNCLIIVVIHLTKSNGYMTGVLGSLLEKKCQTAIKCEKDEDNEEISNISCQYARDRGFRAFGIKYNEDDEVYERTDATKEIRKSAPPVACSEAVKDSILRQIFTFSSSHKGEREFRQAIKNAANSQGYAELNKKDTDAWLDYFQAEGFVAFNPDYGFMRTERLTAIKKATPELQFIKTDEGDSPADDLPF